MGERGLNQQIIMMNTPKTSYTTAAEQIKEAILSSQYTAAKQVNAVQLSLYYGVGRYVSQNTRKVLRADRVRS